MRRPIARAAADLYGSRRPTAPSWAVAAERPETYDARGGDVPPRQAASVEADVAGAPAADPGGVDDAVAFAPPAGTVAAAVATIRDGLAQLQALDMSDVHDEDLREGLVELTRAMDALDASQTALAAAVDQREAYQADACVSTPSWLRLRTRTGYGAAKKIVKRAWLMERMPYLARAFLEGKTTAEHLDAVAYRAVGGRIDAISSCDQTLAELAATADPRDVRVAVQRIIDAAATDPDGADDPADCTNDDLRGVTLRPGFSELGDLSGATTPVLTSLLRRVFEAFDTPDPADTPAVNRRNGAQRFHDALVKGLTVALDASAGGAVFGGVKAHLVLFADVMTMLGRDDLATLAPHIAGVGHISPELARHLAATTNPTLRAVLSMGPWLPIALTRASRTIDGPLREVLAGIQVTCAGPGCELPVSLCEADHREPYSTGGETSLTNTDPQCRAHNVLKHTDGWTVTFDFVTGTHTWTSRDKSKSITVPPRKVHPWATAGAFAVDLAGPFDDGADPPASPGDIFAEPMGR